MNTKLTIQEKLKDLRVERHLTLEQLAEETGISKSALGKYESDDFKDISPFSIVTLAKFCGVSTDYLLGLTETKNHPNTDLHDLHLGDDMIELLKSGKLNNRLLSELALHKDFQRFLVDIEIFVDRVADMRINAMTIQNSIRDKGGVFHYILFHLSKNGEVLRDVAVGQLVSDQEWSRPLCGSGYGGIPPV